MTKKLKLEIENLEDRIGKLIPVDQISVTLRHETNNELRWVYTSGRAAEAAAGDRVTS